MNECPSGKIAYKTPQEAWQTKKAMNKAHGKADIYKCSICCMYHFGRKKAVK